jgi:hypothetical protein
MEKDVNQKLVYNTGSDQPLYLRECKSAKPDHHFHNNQVASTGSGMTDTSYESAYSLSVAQK